MEHTTHSTQGLKLCEVFIEDGSIMMGIPDHYFHIGELETLLSLPPYEGGVYETSNGLDIDLEQFIKNMGIPPYDATDIKHASTQSSEEGEISNRLGAFNAYLHRQLEGNIARKDDEGNIVEAGG